MINMINMCVMHHGKGWESDGAYTLSLFEGSLEVKLPTIWTDEMKSRAGQRQREEED